MTVKQKKDKNPPPPIYYLVSLAYTMGDYPIFVSESKEKALEVAGNVDLNKAERNLAGLYGAIGDSTFSHVEVIKFQGGVPVNIFRPEFI